MLLLCQNRNIVLIPCLLEKKTRHLAISLCKDTSFFETGGGKLSNYIKPSDF